MADAAKGAPGRPRPAILCILDGWGFRPDARYNAILDARTPNFDRLVATCPQGLIDASETFVGLPKDSERADVIAYLNSLADNPAPLPKAAENAGGSKTQ